MRILLLAAVLLIGLVGQAQEGLVRSAMADFAYPMAIRFGFDLTVPVAEIDRAVLSIQVNDRPARLIPLRPADVALVIDEPEARLRYVWALPADGSVAWFDGVRYRWTARLADGRTAEAEGEITITDPRLNWERRDGPEALPYTIALAGRDATIGRDLDMMIGLIRANAGTNPPIRWLVYPKAASAGCDERLADDGTITLIALALLSDFAVPCDPPQIAALTQGWQVIQPTADQTTEGAIAGALVAAHYEASWAGKGVPAWFAAALARFYAPSSDAALLLEARARARTGQVFTAAEMAQAEPGVAWAAQSMGQFGLLIDRIGALGVFRLANRLASADSFNTALAEAVGLNAETIIPAYRAWLFLPQAEAAFGITPYQAPTATPTVTPTASATPTPTPTTTFTPTVTPTPQVTRTLAPTITPQTPSPAPATVTPRPPGSLQTPTPLPPAPSVLDSVDPQVLRYSILGALIILLAILFVLLARTNTGR